MRKIFAILLVLAIALMGALPALAQGGGDTIQWSDEVCNGEAPIIFGTGPGEYDPADLEMEPCLEREGETPHFWQATQFHAHTGAASCPARDGEGPNFNEDGIQAPLGWDDQRFIYTAGCYNGGSTWRLDEIDEGQPLNQASSLLGDLVEDLDPNDVEAGDPVVVMLWGEATSWYVSDAPRVLGQPLIINGQEIRLTNWFRFIVEDTDVNDDGDLFFRVPDVAIDHYFEQNVQEPENGYWTPANTGMWIVVPDPLYTFDVSAPFDEWHTTPYELLGVDDNDPIVIIEPWGFFEDPDNEGETTSVYNPGWDIVMRWGELPEFVQEEGWVNGSVRLLESFTGRVTVSEQYLLPTPENGLSGETRFTEGQEIEIIGYVVDDAGEGFAWLVPADDGFGMIPLDSAVLTEDGDPWEVHLTMPERETSLVPAR